MVHGRAEVDESPSLPMAKALHAREKSAARRPKRKPRQPRERRVVVPAPPPEAWGGLYIAQWAAAKGIKQKDVAERSGFGQAYVSQLASGKKGFTTPGLKRVADAIGIPVGLLFHHPADVPLWGRLLLIPVEEHVRLASVLDAFIPPHLRPT